MLLINSISRRTAGGIILPPPPENEQLGITYTSAELAVWRHRAVYGPYKSTGDTGKTNSPGGWDRIINQANQLVNSPGHTIDRYLGPTYYVSGGVNVMLGPTDFVPQWSLPEPHSQGVRVLCAAFAGLVLENSTYINAAKTAILDQIRRPETDFSNTTRWKRGVVFDVNPNFVIEEWATRLFIAFDYIRDHFSGPETTEFETWCYWLADLLAYDLNLPLNSRFSNRAGYIAGTHTSYTMTNTGWLTYTGRMTHDGGFNVAQIGQFYNNRKTTCSRFVNNTGIMLNNSFFKNTVKTFFQELLKYGVIPFSVGGKSYNMFCDMERGHNNPSMWEQGVVYSGGMLSGWIEIADTSARNGDFSYYTYSTSEGVLNTIGGPKTLKKLGETYGAMLDKTAGFTQGGELLDGVFVPGNWYTVYCNGLAMGNRFWQSDYFKNVYTRSLPGSNPYPSNPADGQFGWMGQGKTRPDKLFMYGQMEGEISPYIT